MVRRRHGNGNGFFATEDTENTENGNGAKDVTATATTQINGENTDVGNGDAAMRLWEMMREC